MGRSNKMAFPHANLARSFLQQTVLCLPFRTQQESLSIVRILVSPSVQPMRGKKQGFGGFTGDKYALDKRRRARERLMATKKKPMASQTQISRGMERPLTVKSIGETRTGTFNHTCT